MKHQGSRETDCVFWRLLWGEQKEPTPTRDVLRTLYEPERYLIAVSTGWQAGFFQLSQFSQPGPGPQRPFTLAEFCDSYKRQHNCPTPEKLKKAYASYLPHLAALLAAQPRGRPSRRLLGLRRVRVVRVRAEPTARGGRAPDCARRHVTRQALGAPRLL
jgi:hypothetical protein